MERGCQAEGMSGQRRHLALAPCEGKRLPGRSGVSGQRCHLRSAPRSPPSLLRSLSVAFRFLLSCLNSSAFSSLATSPPCLFFSCYSVYLFPALSRSLSVLLLSLCRRAGPCNRTCVRFCLFYRPLQTRPFPLALRVSPQQPGALPCLVFAGAIGILRRPSLESAVAASLTLTPMATAYQIVGMSAEACSKLRPIRTVARALCLSVTRCEGFFTARASPVRVSPLR